MTEEFTLIEGRRSIRIPASVAGTRVRIAPDSLREGLGWELKPQGLCRGEVCVPVGDPGELANASGVDLQAFAEALGRPLALEVSARAAALGTAVADRSRQLDSLEAPDFELPDLSGAPQRLSDHRGKKVLLIVYASW